MKYTYKERVRLARKLKIFLAVFFAAITFFTGKVILDKTFAEDNDYGTATITFNSGTDGQFEDGTTTNTVTYNLIKIQTKYSHTDNISDDGTQNGNYGNNLNTNDVVTIPGAATLHVKITYGGQSNAYDWSCIWEGNHPDYTASANSSSSVSGKLGGGNHADPSNTKEYDITGDTVTFGFKSDGSGVGDGYGYYAVISGKSNDGELRLGTIASGEYKEPIANSAYNMFDEWDTALDTINTTATLTATYIDNALYSGTHDGVDWRVTKDYSLLLGNPNEEQTYTNRASRARSSWPWYQYNTQIKKVTFIGNVHGTGSMENLFYGFSKVISMDLDNFDTTNVTNMDYMFYKCESLPALDLSTFDTSQTTSMDDLFCYCKSLTTLNISNFNTSSVTSMAYMFNLCENIRQLNLIHFNTSQVTNMSSMFSSCTRLEELDISSFNTNSITTMSYMFTATYRLNTLKLGSNFAFLTNAGLECSWTKDNNTTIYTGAELVNSYDGSTMAGTYVTPTTAYAILYENGEMVFQKNSTPDSTKGNVVKTYTGFETTDYDSIYAIPWYDEENLVKKVIFTEEIKPISAYSMFCMPNLTTIENINLLNTSNVTKMLYMFNGCSSLISLDVSNFDTSKVTDMFCMFYGCSNLKKLDVSGFDTSNVTDMHSMFSSCRNLTSLDVSNFDTSKVTDMENMFLNCEKIKVLDVSRWNTSNVTAMRMMFDNCKSLKKLDVSNFNTNKVKNISYMFYDCENLTVLDVSNFDTSSVTSMDSTFTNCKKIKKLDLSSFDTSNVTKMYHLFWGCEKLEVLDLSSFDMTNIKDNYRNTEDFFFYCWPKVLKLGPNWGMQYYKSGFNTNTSYTYMRDGDNTTIYQGFDLTSNYDGTTMAGVYRRTDIEYYVLLYDSGEMVFQEGNTTDSTKGNLVDTYIVVTSSSYTNATDVPWYQERNIVTKITFQDQIAPASTAYWFYDMSNLTKINNISNLTTEMVTSTQSMFENCTKLTSFNMNNIKTNNLTNMNSMFKGCTNLQSLNMSNFKAENLTDVTDIITNTSVKTLNLGNQVEFNLLPTLSGTWKRDGSDTTYTGNQIFSEAKGIYRLQGNQVYAIVYDNGEMVFQEGNTPDPTKGNVLGTYTGFENMSSFTSTTVPWYSNRSTITKVIFEAEVMPISTAYWFYKMGNLTEIENLELLNTSSVKSMSSMFRECENLTTLDVSNFDTSLVTNMGGMFSSCRKLTALDVSNFDTSKVTTFETPIGGTASVLSGMFSYCEALTTLDVSGFDTSKVTSMAYMFINCKNLTALDVSNFNTSNVTNMSCMFSSCEGLVDIDLSNFNTSKVTNMSNMFSSCKSLTTLDVSMFDTSKVTDMQWMFQGCNELTTLDLSNFNTANVTNMKSMFSNSGFLNLDLSNFNTSKVTDMEKMFLACRDLISLDLSSFDTNKVTSMLDMFWRCNSLSNLDLSSFDTSNVTMMSGMFSFCGSLKTLDLSNFNTSNVTNMSGLFKSCTGLTNLDLSSFDTGSVTDMNGMFEATTKVITLKLGTNWNFLSDNGLTKSWGRDGDNIVYTAEELTNSYDGATMSGTYRAMAKLTISEQVKGALADINKNFDFTINVQNNGVGINTTHAYTGSKNGNFAFSNGNATFSLKHGESISTYLPYGNTYTITQNSDGYTLSKSYDTGTLSSDKTATFTDTLNGTTPTGVFLNLIPYIIMLIIGTTGLLWIKSFKRI